MGKKACAFRTTEASVKGWFRKKGLLDKYLNIPEGKLNEFRKQNTKLKNTIRVRFFDKQEIEQPFYETQGGKKVIVNKALFKKIDEMKGIYYQMPEKLVTDEIVQEYNNSPNIQKMGSIIQYAKYKQTDQKSFQKFAQNNPDKTLKKPTKKEPSEPSELLDEKTKNRLISFLANYGVTIEYIENMKERVGDDYTAIALIFEKLILVSKGQEKANTLPEEVAHFAVELLGDENPLVKRLMDNIEETNIYAETYEKYKNLEAYIDENGNPDIYKLKKEAVGKAIRDKILENKEEKYKKGLGRTISLLWEKIKKIFKKINLKQFNDEVNIVSNIIAEQVLEGNLKDPVRDLNAEKTKENINYFLAQAATKSPSTREEKVIQKIIKQLDIRAKQLSRIPLKGKAAQEMRENIKTLEYQLDNKKFEAAAKLFLHIANKDIKPFVEYVEKSKNKLPKDKTIKNMGDFVSNYDILTTNLKGIIKNAIDLNPSDSLKELLAKTTKLQNSIEELDIFQKEARKKAYIRGLLRMNDGRLQKPVLDDDGKVIGYEDAIDESVLEDTLTDTSWLRKVVGNLENAVDPVLKLVSDKVKSIREIVSQYTYNTGRKIVQAQEDLYKSGITKTSVFYEKDSKGNFTGFLISKYNRGAHAKAKFNFLDSLAKKYGAKSHQDLDKNLLTTQEVASYNREIRVWYKSSANKVASYPNPEFNRLMSNSAAKKYYDLILEVKTDSVEKLPFVKGTAEKDAYHIYLLPQIRKTSVERILKNKDNKFKTVLQIAKENIDIVEDDIEFKGAEVMTDIAGKKFKFLPTYFTRKLDDMSNLTEDLSYSTILYAKMSEDFYQKNNVLPLMEMIREEIGERSVIAQRGKKDKQKKETNTYQALDKFLDMHFYGGIKNKDQKVVIRGKTFNYGKILDTFNAYVRRNNLGFSIFTTAAGYTVGSVYSKIEDLIGDYSNQDSKTWAEKTFDTNVLNVLSQIGKKKPTNKMHLMLMKHGFVKTNFENLNIDTVAGRQIKDIFYSTYQLADYRVKGKIGLAVMDNFRYFEGEWVDKNKFERIYIDGAANKKQAKKESTVEWKKLRDKSFYNAHFINKQGDLEVKEAFKDKIDINIQKLVRNRIVHIGNRADGMLDEMDKGAIAQNVWGRLLLTHRGWLVKGVEDRFKKGGLNLATGIYEEGSFRSAWNYSTSPNIVGTTIFNMFREKKKEITPFLGNFHNLEKAQQKNVLRIMTELIAIGMLMGIIKAFEGSLKGDDDDWATQMALYLLYRTKMEIGAFYNPMEYRRLLKSPAAGLNQAESIADAFSMLNFLDVDDEGHRGGFQTFERGRYKDKSGFFKFAVERSILKNFYGAMYPEDKVTYLK